MVFEKSLTVMVKGIRAHRGRETEYINACMQEIQKEVQSKNLATKSMAVLKLAYLTMLGYDMSWSTFAVVEVMSHNRFAIKRPGYLASAMSFTDNTDVGLLTINLFKKDFGSQSQYVSGMAISCLSSICSPEICRDILNDLMAMLSSSRPYLRKKTTLCLFRMFVKDPPALRTCFPKLKERLGDEDQGVLTATVNTFLELARKNARNYLSLVPQLYHILVNTSNNWLSIKLLKMFQLLCPLEPRLPNKMVEPLTNLLQNTKAQSVEFEAIRCVVRIMPEGIALTGLAMEKLQAFLNSSDRNLRYLALDLFKEVLEKPLYKEKFNIRELHAKVLQSIEESDVTARRIALQLLDCIVGPATFADAVKKLMEFSKKTLPNDEFVGTILRMGARDRYALIEDFAWYLLVLAEISRNMDSNYSSQVAEQFIDVTVRVPQVRPYAVALALSLLERPPSGSEVIGLDLAPPMIGASAWVLGEYHASFEEAKEQSIVKGARALLTMTGIEELQPMIQAQCIWAATKLYLGSAKNAPGAVTELHGLLDAHLPAFVRSVHVEVSERAALALKISTFFKANAEKVAAGAALVEEPLLPVQQGAQASLPQPVDLRLDERFFVVEKEAPPMILAPVQGERADYKDDLGFHKSDPSPSATSSGQQSSMYYLQSKSQSEVDASGDQKASEAQRTEVDPLEQMRERLAATRVAAGPKYQVMRDELQAPQAAQAPSSSSTGAAPLPTPTEKELTDLQGRIWLLCCRGEDLAVYACVRSKNARKQLLRIDFRCERITSNSGSVSNVALRLPPGVAATEVDAEGLLVLVQGELQERSPKVKVNISLALFQVPTVAELKCELTYSLGPPGGAPKKCAAGLRLPATTFLLPAVMTEDDLATYIAQNSSQLSQQVCKTINLTPPASESSNAELAVIVGRCAGLCNFHGIQQQAPAAGLKGQKFLLVALPPQSGAPGGPSFQGQQAMPPDSRVVCLCAAMPRDDGLVLRITVKSSQKDLCDDVCEQLAETFRELVEGRLR